MSLLTVPSPFDTVFCPVCDRFLGDAAACPQGDWERPAFETRIGHLQWQTSLAGTIGKPYIGLRVVGQRGFVCLEREGQKQTELHTFDVATSSAETHLPLNPNSFSRYLTVADYLLIASSESLSALGKQGVTVRAMAADTLTTQWETTLPARSHSAPVRFGDWLVCAASDHRVYALDPANGEVVWQSADLPSWYPAPPAASDDALFVGGYTNTISRIAADGSVTTLFKAARPDDWFDGELHYHDGAVYAPCSNRHLYALDAESGALRWQVRMGRGLSAPIAVAEQVYVPYKGRLRGEYHLSALARETGAIAWTYTVPSHILMPPLLHDDTLFIGTRKGQFVALDPANGEVRWQIETEQTLRGAPVIVGSHVLFGSADGAIFAVRWQKQEKAVLLSAEKYRAEGEWLLAGTVAALAGDWAAAASDYAKASRPYCAAQLYERAADWQAAAPQYAQAERYAEALAAYQQVGDRRQSAEMLLKLNQSERAVDLFVALNDHARAAIILHEIGLLKRAAHHYAQAGDIQRATDLYIALKQPEHAAQLWVQHGDIDAAVTIWEDQIGDYERAAGLLLQHDRHADAADLLERNSLIAEAATVWRDVQAFTDAARVYERAKLWVESAECYLQADNKGNAAHAFYQAGKIKRAAKLYLQIGELKQAITLYRQLNQFAAIADIYEQDGQWQAAAHAHLATNPPNHSRAADCFMRIQQWQDAANAYVTAGEIDAAVAVWRDKSETPRKAAELLREEGRLLAAAELFTALDELQDAADIFEQLGDIAQAVALHQQLGNDEAALHVATQHDAWEIVLRLANARGAYEQEAEAALALAQQNSQDGYLHYRAAASAFVRAAQALEEREPRLLEDQAVAKLWERAADCFKQGLIEDEEAVTQQCLREMRRLLKWPEIALDVQARRTLVINEYHSLIVKIKNIGHGLAMRVYVKPISEAFDGQMQSIRKTGIPPQQTVTMRLNVRPKSAGESVPLSLHLSYLRPDKQEIERTIHTTVPVHHAHSKAITSPREARHRAPIELHRDEQFDQQPVTHQVINYYIQGDYTGGDKIDIDKIENAKGVAIGKSSSARVSEEIASNDLTS